jgi:hypothetical protein
MPIGRGRLFERELGSPVQQVLATGLSGEGLNPFTAPSKWKADHYSPPGAGTYRIEIAAVANKAIRLYRYVVTVVGPAVGAGANFAVCYNSNVANLIYYFNGMPTGAALFACYTFGQDFGPCGIAWNINQNLAVYSPAAGGEISFFCQYSLEPFGAVDDGN